MSHRSSFRPLGLLMALLTIAGCEATREPVEIDEPGAQRSEIINGFVQTGMPEVVFISSDTGGCTGTVIADYVVLTAKHCVTRENGTEEDPFVSPNRILVYRASDVTGPEDGIEKSVGVNEIHSTPGTFLYNWDRNEDVAVLLLKDRLGTEMREIRRTNPIRGESVTLVGFGRTFDGATGDGGAGVKRQGSSQVVNVSGYEVQINGESNSCRGDSGGPAIGEDGRIIGVSSNSPEGCIPSNYARVGIHLTWIEPLLGYIPPCEPEPRERCGDAVDNDCNGFVDEQCTALGDGCVFDEDCENGSCEAVDGRNVCVRDCDPRDLEVSCPLGFLCEPEGCGEGRCVLSQPGAGADGERCSDNADCASFSCAAIDIDGSRRCGRACSPELSPCGGGLTCDAESEAGCGQCLPVDLATSPLSFGASCSADAECRSGTCRDGLCTAACDDMSPCPGGTHCREGLCADGPLALQGASCVHSDDCAPAAPDCIAVDEKMLCAGACNAGDLCSTGFQCEDTEAGARCTPSGLALGEMCTDHANCRSGICAGVCTALCDDASPCPAGFLCQQAGELSGCFPVRQVVEGAGGGGSGGGGGGCSVADANDEDRVPALWLVLLGLLGVRPGRLKRR